MSRTELFFDIETLPTSDPAVIADITAGVTPPGNISKQETIDAWMVEKKPALVDDAVRKTALDPWLGKILCVGLAFGEGEAFSIISDDEYEVLLQTVALFDKAYSNNGRVLEPRVIGHYITGFDLRFFWARCIVNGIHPPAWWPVDAKPWESDRVFDTMTQAAGVGGKVSLDKLCHALRVPSPKGDLDGSKVYDYWKEGRLDEIATYCARDVEAEREVYKRLALISLPHEQKLAA